MNKYILSALFLLTFTSNSTPTKNNLYRDMANHFYYIKRLAQSAHFLSLLHKQHYLYKPCNIIKEQNSISIDSTFFSHPKIVSCISKMLSTETLKPIVMLLTDMTHYGYFKDEQFVHEFFLLIFIVHKQILFHECDETHSYVLKTISLNTIIEISEKINQLPIAEILNAIDMLVTELPPFLEKYEFNSTISWKAWLKKYWWVPPIFSGWFGLKVLLSLQKPHFFYSPYLAPKPLLTLPPIQTDDPALQEISILH